MNRSRIILAVAVLMSLLVAGPAAANEWLWGLTYETAVPVGDTKEFSQDSFSWRGMGFEGRSFIYQEMTVGFSVSWNVFHSKLSNQTFSQPGQDLHGTQLRDINAVPIYLNMHYYGGQRYGWRPYFGLNAGTMYAEHRLDMGLYSFREENWHFAVAPEIGIQFPYDRLLGYFSIRWNYGMKSGEIDEVNYFSFRFGIGLR